MENLVSIMIFLLAAITVVPLFTRFGLGAVLGYLVAGILLGPSVLSVFWTVDNVMHLAEFGVIFLMFVIGLELQPSRLWVLRKSVFGLGALQVLTAGSVGAAVAFAFGLSAIPSLLVGFSLSLSSTALVLQSLAEKNQLTTQFGRFSFAILLFQDLAVIPLLSLLPLLKGTASGSSISWVQVGIQVSAVVGIVVMGRLFFRPMFRWIARTNARELLTSTGLLIVVASSALMYAAGLSMALGAFLAGVVLADSEFRHEIEADIDPFKGLLMGLFFMTIGIQANLEILIKSPVQVILGVIGIFVLKFLTLFILKPFTKLSWDHQRRLAIHLAQGGEFSFVIFGICVGLGLLPKELSEYLVMIVTLSMLVAPLIFTFDEKFIVKWVGSKQPKREYDKIENENPEVIIAGFGRFGQIIARVLTINKIPFTALEKSSQQVDFVRRFGSKIYYGDASRMDLLRAAHVDKAKAFVLAIDDVESSVKTAESVRKHFPNVKIFARARNRQHAYKLMDLNVKFLERETFLSSVNVAKNLLVELGVEPSKASIGIEKFKILDYQLLARQHAVHSDEKQLIQTSKEYLKELENLFESDAEEEPATQATTESLSN